MNHLRPSAAVALLEHCFVYDYCRFDVLCGLADVAPKPDRVAAPDPVQDTRHRVQVRVALRPSLSVAPLHAARIGAALVRLGARLKYDVRVFLLKSNPK